MYPGAEGQNRSKQSKKGKAYAEHKIFDFDSEFHVPPEILGILTEVHYKLPPRACREDLSLFFCGYFYLLVTCMAWYGL
jgi:hypothetical protein